MTPPSPDAIDRREALRRAALVLGGVLSTPLMSGVLAGCEARRAPAAGWRPRALTPDQVALVATVAEHILPETDTPGARAVGVDRFIDGFVAEGYAAAEREQFVSGLASLGRALRELAPAEQLELLERLDREAEPFFRTLKELTLVGYYTSEAGATRELRHAPAPGRFEGCVPLTQIGRTWAV